MPRLNRERLGFCDLPESDFDPDSDSDGVRRYMVAGIRLQDSRLRGSPSYRSNNTGVERARLLAVPLCARVGRMSSSDTLTLQPSRLSQGMRTVMLSSLCFGSMAVCVGIATREMPASQVAFFRFLGSFLVMLGATRGRGLRVKPGNLAPIILRGVVGAAAIIFYFVGIAGVGPGLATLIQNTYPVFAAIFAGVFLGERMSGRLAIALGLNLIGVGVIVLGPESQIQVRIGLGVASAAGSAVLAGAAVTAVRHLRRSESASLITTWFMGVAMLATSPSLLWGLPPLTPRLVAALLGVVLTSIGGQWLLHHGLGFTTAAQGSLAAASNVLVATVLGALITGEGLTPEMFAGGALMFGAIILASRSGS